MFLDRLRRFFKKSKSEDSCSVKKDKRRKKKNKQRSKCLENVENNVQPRKFEVFETGIVEEGGWLKRPRPEVVGDVERMLESFKSLEMAYKTLPQYIHAPRSSDILCFENKDDFIVNDPSCAREPFKKSDTVSSTSKKSNVSTGVRPTTQTTLPREKENDFFFDSSIRRGTEPIMGIHSGGIHLDRTGLIGEEMRVRAVSLYQENIRTVASKHRRRRLRAMSQHHINSKLNENGETNREDERSLRSSMERYSKDLADVIDGSCTLPTHGETMRKRDTLTRINR